MIDVQGTRHRFLGNHVSVWAVGIGPALRAGRPYPLAVWDRPRALGYTQGDCSVRCR